MKPARRRSSHDPRACRLLSRRRARYALLAEASSKFRRLITDDAMWPAFVAAFPELATLIEHERRATRSDLREGLALVVEAELSRTDVMSLRVGWRRRYRASDGRTFDFVGLPRDVVARWAGLAPSTTSRALTLLRRASILSGPGRDGFNVIPQPVQACDVTPRTPRGCRGLPAVRRFHESFFAALGMAGWLAKERDRRSAKRAPAAPVAAASAAAAVGRLVDALALERPPDG